MEEVNELISMRTRSKRSIRESLRHGGEIGWRQTEHQDQASCGRLPVVLGATGNEAGWLLALVELK